MTPETPPHWDLTNVYPSLASREFAAAVEHLTSLLDEQKKFLEEKVSSVDEKSAAGLIAETAGQLIDRYNEILVTSGTFERLCRILRVDQFL